MSLVYKCDICGKYEPRSIRRLLAHNPDVSEKPLNQEEYYAFNLFHGDFCDECLHQIERAIADKIYKMKEQKNDHHKRDIQKSE